MFLRILFIIVTCFSSAEFLFSGERQVEEIYYRIQKYLSHPNGFPSITCAVESRDYEGAKFLIDMDEPINAETPSKPIYFENLDTDNIYISDLIEPGYTVLEIAIMKQDVEMVNILTSYHYQNRSKPELTHIRFYKNQTDSFSQFADGYLFIGYFPPQAWISTPLAEAIRLGNLQIITLVLRAYTDPEIFFKTYKEIRALQSRQIMYEWIKQNVVLWKGEISDPAEEIVELFCNFNLMDLIKNHNYEDLKKMLENGWIVSKDELKVALNEEDEQLISLILNNCYRSFSN